MLPSPPPGRNASADSAGSPKKKHVHHDGEQVDVDRKVQERMDQKLMYTRNPRYDPGNKNNHRLLTLPVQGTDVEQDITGLLCPTGAPEGGTGAVIDAWAARTKVSLVSSGRAVCGGVHTDETTRTATRLIDPPLFAGRSPLPNSIHPSHHRHH